MNSFTNPCLPNQPARMLRAGIAAALLVCATGGGAVESISWDFYSGGFDKGGSTTDGIPVTDSAADSDGYVGTVNAALDWSDISVRSRVPSSYGQSTTAGSRISIRGRDATAARERDRRPSYPHEYRRRVA